MRLADAFKDSLKIIPGLELNLPRPDRDLRFNELITGVRARFGKFKVFGG